MTLFFNLDKILNKSMIKLKNSIFLGAELLFFCIFLKNMLLELDRMNHQTTSELKYFSFASAKSSIILGNV
ncbi:hypothetical protein BpHYR1_001482 [Brachionus plicatilis]|uniref:Uncharacterized protein n=1 Tax=Brachionus plicatilis TaxID=10195 RepID=A0A3M7QRC1_BRAPC|nr:hypothetical protein BpHYR1_001482 [Brachionus plicatilis]